MNPTRPKLTPDLLTSWLEARTRTTAARFYKKAAGDMEALTLAVHDDLVSSADYSDRMAEAMKAVKFNKAWVGSVLNTAQKNGQLGKLAQVLGWVGEALDAQARGLQPVLEQAAGGKKPPLGSGARFKALSKKVGSKALAAWIGRKKLGGKKMAALAEKGKRRAARMGESSEAVAAMTNQAISDYFVDAGKRKLPGPLIGYLIRIGNVKRGGK